MKAFQLALITLVFCFRSTISIWKVIFNPKFKITPHLRGKKEKGCVKPMATTWVNQPNLTSYKIWQFKV